MIFISFAFLLFVFAKVKNYRIYHPKTYDVLKVLG